MGRKMTPTHFAKLMVLQKGTNWIGYWEGGDSLEVHLLTDREKEKIGKAIEKQLDRVHKLLGDPEDKFWDLPDTGYNRYDDPKWPNY